MEETSWGASRAYDGQYGRSINYGSTTSLAPNAARPAFSSRFSEAGAASDANLDDHEAESFDDGAAPAAPAAGGAVGAANQPQVYKPPFYLRKWFLLTSGVLGALGLALLFITLYPVVKAIAQLVVDRSALNIDVAQITNPQNGTFTLALQGVVTHTGIFAATIAFTEKIAVTWKENTTTGTPLGFMTLTQLSAHHKRAYVNQTTQFTIIDQEAFGRFSAHLITAENFTWNLKSDNLRVQAIKFPVDYGIHFNKDLTLPAINNFNGNVELQSLELPSDSPDGGINFSATTMLHNPSAFALNLGTVNFGLTYNGVYLGQGTGTNTQIVPGNNSITLAGVLIPQFGAQNLSQISQLFTNYINGDNSPVIATGLSTTQADGVQISWLSQALQSLVLDVPFKPQAPLNPIQTIDINELGLSFTEGTEWSPGAASNSVHASLVLPFGFNLAIEQIQNDFNITTNGSAVAGLATPIGASQSTIDVVNSTYTTGNISITIANSALTIPSEMHSAFSTFTTNLTDSLATSFQLVGNSAAVANTSIGVITLNPIKVNVTTSLFGLKGLKGLTVIESVDVTGGTPDAITLSIGTNIYNPSSLELATGDLTLQLFRETAVIGTALLPNLTLELGNNTVTAVGSFSPNNSPFGQQTLDQFVGGTDVDLAIVGYSQSTDIASLLQAFESLNISVVLPGLNASLLESAALIVLPTTGVTNNISQVTVNLVNPFTAGLDITKITSSVTSHGIALGTIATSTNFTSVGKSTTTSPTLDLNLNFDPAALFTLTRVLAVEAGESTAQLDGIVQLGGYQYVASTNADAPPSKREAEPRDLSKRNIYTGFDLPTFIDTAFKQLRSDVELTAEVTIGEYQTTLNYTQLSVPITTDSSLNYLLPVLAQPIVQKIVDEAVIAVDTVLISDPELNQFTTLLTGSITNAGPFDAVISFPNGLTVSWNGSPLGNLDLYGVDVVGDVGAQLNNKANFAVADVDHLTDFTKYLLTQESFEWQLSAENLTVSALGINVTGISLSTRTVTLKGFNGLKGGVTIQSFDLPSNDPAGGITLTIESTVANPSQVGIAVSSLAFNAFYGSTGIGPVASTGAVTLLPQSTSPLSLAGRLIPQTSASGLAAVSTVFNNFVHGESSNVSVVGASAGDSSVTWLNEGIQSLEVATLLPNMGVLNVITAIDLAQLTLMFTEPTEYDPAASTTDTSAAFTLPFAFPVDIVATEQNITAAYNGQSFAELIVPEGPATTDVGPRIIHLTFANVPFAASDHGVFSSFLAATTTGKEETLTLSGSVNAQASTGVGVLSLMDIEFSVQSTIAGLQGLDAEPASVSNLDVASGTPEYLLITVDTTLVNPSNLTIGTGDVSFGLEFQGATIGQALISALVIVPGNATYPTNVHYSPQGSAVTQGQHLLENYIQGVDSQTTIQGSTSSTPVASLQEALSEITLTPVTIPALHQNLIISATLEFPTDIVQTGIAQSSFVLANPFTASINILTLTAVATYKGLTLGEINHVDRSSDPITAGGHQNITSPTVPLQFNLDPVTIVTLISDSAQTNNVDLGPLTALFQVVISEPNFKSSINSSVDTGPAVCVSGQQFDVDDAIINALKGLQVDLAIESSLKLDQYATDLTFNQSGVTAITDSTALYLIGAVAPPIVQSLVDGADLVFTQANITNLSDGGFDLSLVGSLTNIGPLDAKITFVEPVVVSWMGSDIATITLPPVCAAANTGVPSYVTSGTLAITDLTQFTAFATYLLHNPSFTWIISTPKLQVEALGTIFTNVQLQKNITLAAFNGLPGVTISNFQLPSDDPAGGIHMDTDANIPSPSQLGIDLGTVGFIAYYDNVEVGPLSGSNLFLAADTNTTTALSGRIIPQTGSDADVIGQLFSEYLQADTITLIAKGDSVVPSGSSVPISWLSAAFKTLSLSVSLAGQKFQIIESIAINDFNVEITSQNQAYEPTVGSNSTMAEYRNPFGFSLQVIQSAVDMVVGLANNGTSIGSLALPTSDTVGGVSTGNLASLPISFANVPFPAINNGAMQTLFQEVTDTSGADVTLSGTANVTAKTTSGNIPISGIAFNVPSSLTGIDGFGKTAQLTNVTVAGSGGTNGNQYIVNPLTTTLQNPSNISLETNNIALPVIYSGTQLGRASISPFNLVPGENTIPTEFLYEPADANDTTAQAFLTQFLQTSDTIPLTVQGDSASTPYGSLQPALEGVTLQTSVTGIVSKPIIAALQTYISLVDALATGEIEASFDIYNPLDAPLKITFVQADSYWQGTLYAHFDQSFDDFVIPPGQTVNSGVFGNVVLTQGLLGSLVIVGENLDVQSAATTM
ncbi:hypothetical protein HWV62_22882 [Athelia sp. TMB]|nr:hypothetical protein HWV62_22882 [Athelia sp. TMB]